MPELPEVETIRRGLKDFIIGQAVKRVDVACDKSFRGSPTTIEGATVRRLRRFGKALVVDLDNQNSLIIHLRMTGQLIYDDCTHPRYAAGHPSDNFVATLPNQQTRVTISFTHGVLYFNDQRKFGFIKVVSTPAVEQDSFIKKLAPEPWNIDPDIFYATLQRHKNSQIKPTILDQTVIAGLGNIYADESLFMSKIHPARRCSTITREEATNIIKNAKTVMERSIASGGSTMQTYVKADGTTGDYLDKFAQVFHREGQPCPVCRTPIKKIKISGRGTHFCPHCQPDPASYHSLDDRRETHHA